MLLLRYAIRDGRGAGFRALVGILAGLTVVTILLVSGVGLALASIAGALEVLTLIGAIVLLVLGITASINGIRLIRRSRIAPESPSNSLEKRASRARPLQAAFVTNATNPKVLVFYLAFFPQFLGSATSPTWQLILLGGVFLVVTVMWLVPLVYAANAMRRFFRTPSVAASLELVSAAVFILLAGILLTSGQVAPLSPS